MILCLCRKFNGDKPLNENAVAIHIQRNPELLSEAWDIVSFDMTDRAMVCGRCEDSGNECLNKLRSASAVAHIGSQQSALVCE